MVATAALIIWRLLKMFVYQEIEHKERTISAARESIDRCVSESIQHLYERGSERFIVFYDPVETISALVKHLHVTLATLNANAEQPWRGPLFQVAFMTVMDDGEIGIVAWANNENRMPPSLKYRNANKTIYRTTVTAAVYRSERPRMRIVEDSADDTEHVVELYDGEFSRLRSSVVYPVRSPDNELLGTLVAHCDLPHFFRRVDERFWGRLLEIYALRIALEKVRLDRAHPAGRRQYSKIVVVPDEIVDDDETG